MVPDLSSSSSSVHPVGSAQGRDLATLFHPRSIAVIGASQDPDKMGSVMARSLASFDGPLFRINNRSPHPEKGLFRSLQEATPTTSVDLAVLCVPPNACAQALEDAAAAGVRSAVVCAGGFSEAGSIGAKFESDLADVARRHDIALLGPNTSGFIVPSLGIAASFVPAIANVETGGIAVVASSGGVHHALAFSFAEAGYGLSLGVGLGNGIDVTTADVLDFLCSDPKTTAVALHLESIADAQHLLEATKRLSRRCPVVALVVGKNDVGEFAASHTGSLATSWRTVRAALRQHGAVLVEDERQLVDAVGALSTRRLSRKPPRPRVVIGNSVEAPDKPGIGVITGQAGPGLLMLDRLRGLGHSVPELSGRTQEVLSELLPPLTFQANPVDTGRPGDTFGAVVAAVGEDQFIDALAIYALHEPDALDVVEALTALGPALRTPMVVGVGGFGDEPRQIRRALIQNGIAACSDPSGVANGIDALVKDLERHEALWNTGPSDGAERNAAPPNEAPESADLHDADLHDADLHDADEQQPDDPATTRAERTVLASLSDVERAMLNQDGWTEAEAKQLLNALGISTPQRVVAKSRAAALDAFELIDAPVTLKVLDSTLLHKTEARALLLDLGDSKVVSDGYDQLVERFPSCDVLVEAMAPEGVDLMVSAFHDPLFGPMVAVGFGGFTAELDPDVTFRVAPLSAEEAAGMKEDLVGCSLLDGWRDGPVLNGPALGALVAKLGDFLRAVPAVGLIEVNPLRVVKATDGGVGLLALDAVIVHRVTPDPIHSESTEITERSERESAGNRDSEGALTTQTTPNTPDAQSTRRTK